MKKPLTLSEIAIGIFALLLICTFALQLNLNRSSGNKVVAQTIVTYECPIDGEEYTVPPRCVQAGAVTMDAYGRRVRCLSTCQYEYLEESTPKTDNPGCCVFDPTKKTVTFEPNTSQANCPTSTVEDLALLSKTQKTPLKWYADRSLYDDDVSRTGFCGVRPAQRCGNGFLEPPVEQCEPGVIPCRNGAECKDDCTCGILESCGNGITDRGEECDDGPRNGNADNVRCRLDCTDWRCGDGYLDTNLGEQCDDGNTFAGDGCSAFCRFEEGEEEIAITPEEEENPLFFMTTALQQSNPLYFMLTQVVQWNLQSILTPFANLQDFLFPQEIWSQILGE